MIREAFRMRVNDGAAEEYERRHRPIWKELERFDVDVPKAPHDVGRK